MTTITDFLSQTLAAFNGLTLLCVVVISILWIRLAREIDRRQAAEDRLRRLEREHRTVPQRGGDVVQLRRGES